MELKIKSVVMENFQCHENKSFDFSDNYNELRGFNGVGKTTVLSAIVWCLSGSDYLGNKKPIVSPVINEEIQDVKTIVTLTMEYTDGEDTKELIIKRGFKGASASIYVDGIKNKKSEYEDYMKEKFGLDMEEIVLLTNPNYIATLPWKDLRSIIDGLFKGVSDEDVINDNDKYKPLGAKIIEHGVVKMKTSIHEQNSELKNNKIPNLNGKIETYNSDVERTKFTLNNLKQLQSEKADILVKINTYDERMDTQVEKSNAIRTVKSQIQDLQYNVQTQRNRAMDIVNKGKDLARKIEELSDVEGIKKTQINEIDKKINSLTSSRNELERGINWNKEKGKAIKDEFNELKSENIRVEGGKCPSCGQDLPKEQLEGLATELKNKKNNKLTSLNTMMNGYATSINKSNEELQQLDNTINELTKEKEMVNELDYHDLVNDDSKIEKLKLERSKLLEEYSTIELKVISDKQAVIDLEKKLETLPQAEVLPSPIMERERLDLINGELMEVENHKLMNDKLEEAKEELEKAVKLYTKGVNIENMLIEFQKDKAQMVADKLKEKFQITSFITSEMLKNGEEKETFKLMMDGRPYNLLSTGEKIKVGLDLLNGVQNMKGISLPIMIDSIGELSEIPEHVSDKQFIACRTVEVPKGDIDEKKKQQFIESFSELRLLTK